MNINSKYFYLENSNGYSFINRTHIKTSYKNMGSALGALNELKDHLQHITDNCHVSFYQDIANKIFVQYQSNYKCKIVNWIKKLFGFKSELESINNIFNQIKDIQLDKIKWNDDSIKKHFEEAMNNQDLLFIDYLARNFKDQLKNFCLHLAAQQGGDKEVFKTLIQHFCIDQTNPFGQTALNIAINKGDKDLVEWLIKEGADLNKKFYLHEAITTNQLEICRALIERGININRENQSSLFPLNLAIQMQRQEIVDLLIDKGVDLNQGYPLHQALRIGNVNICHVLIDHQVDLNQKDSTECSPLYLAISSSYPLELGKLLIEKGADLNQDYSNLFSLANKLKRKQVFDFIQKHREKLNSKNSN
jgi:ankyrin repeat protein